MVQLITGTFIFSYGTALYILQERGAGPRDSLMLALSRKTGRSMGLVRTGMEVAVTGVGYLLGGPLGAGTVIFAFTVGFYLELCFKIIGWQTEIIERIWLRLRKTDQSGSGNQF